MQIDIKKEFPDVLEKPADSTKDPTSYTSNTTVSKERDIDLSTFQGVLKESFILLFERVSEDMKILWKLFGPVLRPLFETISFSARLVWRHLRPKSNINRDGISFMISFVSYLLPWALDSTILWPPKDTAWQRDWSTSSVYSRWRASRVHAR